MSESANSRAPFHVYARGGDAVVTPKMDGFGNYFYVDRARNVGILAHVHAKDQYADLRATSRSIEVVIGHIGTMVEFRPDTIAILNSGREVSYCPIAPGTIIEMMQEYERRRESPSCSLAELVMQFVPNCEALEH